MTLVYTGCSGILLVLCSRLSPDTVFRGKFHWASYEIPCYVSRSVLIVVELASRETVGLQFRVGSENFSDIFAICIISEIDVTLLSFSSCGRDCKFIIIYYKFYVCVCVCVTHTLETSFMRQLSTWDAVSNTSCISYAKIYNEMSETLCKFEGLLNTFAKNIHFTKIL